MKKIDQNIKEKADEIIELLKGFSYSQITDVLYELRQKVGNEIKL